MTALLLALTTGLPSGAFVEMPPRASCAFEGRLLAERHFANQPFDHPFIGFYDWLRTPSREVVGVRFLLADHAESLAAALPSDEYIVRQSPHAFTIFFGGTKWTIDEEESADQDFGETRVFSDDGLLVIAVDASSIEGEDVVGLRRVHFG